MSPWMKSIDDIPDHKSIQFLLSFIFWIPRFIIFFPRNRSIFFEILLWFSFQLQWNQGISIMNSQKFFLTSQIKPDIENASAYVIRTMKVSAISDETMTFHYFVSSCCTAFWGLIVVHRSYYTAKKWYISLFIYQKGLQTICLFGLFWKNCDNLTLVWK